MPTVEFDGERIDCERGALLREVLRDAGVTPHNGRATLLNCRGLGSCGTCAVEVEGDVSDRSPMEGRRLSFPPHDRADGLRLACRTRVEGDLRVRKYGGFWGHRAGEDPIR